MNNIEKIGNLILDYTFYNGDDEYSDGKVEDVLLEIVKNNIGYDHIIDKLTVCLR